MDDQAQQEITALVDDGQHALIDELEKLDQSSRKYAASARAASTRRAYQSAWTQFSKWCHSLGVERLPATPPVVRLYIAKLADEDYATTTISRRLTTIRQAHEVQGLADPTISPEVRQTWKGIRRELGTATQPKMALLLDDIRSMSRALPDDTKGMRDRALILVGWVGALRRSEIAALDVGDVAFENSYAVLHLGRSKTDQEGAGAYVKLTAGVEALTCPVRSLKTWLDEADIDGGPLFRGVDRWGNVLDGRISESTIARAIKSSATTIGIDPAQVAGHSLRRGHVTQAARNGARKSTIRNQTRHSSDRMVETYTEALDIVADSSADHLGH